MRVNLYNSSNASTATGMLGANITTSSVSPYTGNNFDPGIYLQLNPQNFQNDGGAPIGPIGKHLWGPDRNLDFWTARAAGLVLEPERRAMKLLASECDEERFALYCHIGMIAALGNLTKHLYIVRRYTTVVELSDGRPIQGWCVVTRDRHVIPETDHVLALKSLIEGEEYSFRATGNRVGTPVIETGGIEDPYQRPFMPKTQEDPKNSVLAVCEKMRDDLASMKWKMEFGHKVWSKAFGDRVRPLKQYSRQEWEIEELRSRLLIGVGAEPQNSYGF